MAEIQRGREPGGGRPPEAKHGAAAPLVTPQSSPSTSVSAETSTKLRIKGTGSWRNASRTHLDGLLGPRSDENGAPRAAMDMTHGEIQTAQTR